MGIVVNLKKKIITICEPILLRNRVSSIRGAEPQRRTRTGRIKYGIRFTQLVKKVLGNKKTIKGWSIIRKEIGQGFKEDSRLGFVSPKKQKIHVAKHRKGRNKYTGLHTIRFSKIVQFRRSKRRNKWIK